MVPDRPGLRDERPGDEPRLRPTFVGLDNFARVLADPLFGRAVGNTAFFALLALIFGFPVPLVLAVVMSEARRFRGLYSALAYLPVVVPPVVSVLLWRFFYDASPTGVFNTVLGWFGLGPLPWLQDAGSAMPSIVIEATWAAAGGTVIIYLAALLSVPPELYDAAEVDGASIWQKIRHVTLPQLRGVLLVTLILQLIATAQLFTEPFLFTGGGPANSTMTVLLLIYHYAFQNSLGGDYGMAAALSVMLAALPGRVHGGLLLAHPVVEHRVVTRFLGWTAGPSDRRRSSIGHRRRAPTGAGGGSAGRCA